MSKIQALLFDLDGTLVDTEELHRQAFNAAFLEFHLDWQWDVDLYMQLLTISGGVDRISRYVDLVDLPAGEKTHLRRLIPAIHREKSRNYGRLLASNTPRLRPGVESLIEQARAAGLKIGVAASSGSANVQSVLSATFARRSSPTFDSVVCADQVARRKPAPDIYELLLTLLGVRASVSVAFEDSAQGIASAQAAGLFVVAAPTRWTESQHLAAADLLLSDLSDLEKLSRGGPAAVVGEALGTGLEHLELVFSSPMKLHWTA